MMGRIGGRRSKPGRSTLPPMSPTPHMPRDPYHNEGDDDEALLLLLRFLLLIAPPPAMKGPFLLLSSSSSFYCFLPLNS